jgi:hypothetical protein
MSDRPKVLDDTAMKVASEQRTPSKGGPNV